ncbi:MULTISPECIES: fatty acid desaturase [Pacificimonas]|uniref:fatty acid desaturase n=1 Tax=Pacificimonas TaxID=1960290 RepID=UPI001CCADA23|nr:MULTISPECIES: fatty acid desaturase [Pacificimonas]
MSRTAQTRIGLAIAAAIITGWLAVHLLAIFAFDLRAEPAGLAAALILLQAWLSTGLFITAHDAMHGSLAPGLPHMQRGIGRIALMIYAGLSYDRLAPKHFAHHKHVGTAHDPDFNADNPRRFWPWLKRFFATYYTHGQIGRITLVALAYLALGARLENIVLFWAVPALLALLQLFTFGTYLPHRQGRSAFPDRHRARSSELPDWLSALTCFHFGGYHHEHHLYPGEPWWRLPARRRSQAGLREGKAAAMSRSVRPNS